jgi:hypothetical protein
MYVYTHVQSPVYSYVHASLFNDAALHYLGSQSSPDYSSSYSTVPKVIATEANAAANERIIYHVIDMSLNADDTLSIFGGASSGGQLSSSCQLPWLKGYIGVQDHSISAPDVAFTPSNVSCTAFTIVNEEPDGGGRRGYNLELFGKLPIIPVAQY